MKASLKAVNIPKAKFRFLETFVPLQDGLHINIKPFQANKR